MEQQEELQGHPYFPRTASIPHYVPNETSVIRLLALFGSIAAAVVVTAYKLPPAKARLVDRYSASWFALCRFRCPYTPPCAENDQVASCTSVLKVSPLGEDGVV